MDKLYVAMKAFIIDEQTDSVFIMRKGNKDPLNPGKWEVPGGKMEWLELVTQTLKREVKEECGLDVEVGEFIVMWQWMFKKDDGSNNEIVACGLICRPLSRKVDFSGQTATDDLVEGKFVPVREVLSYDLIPNMRTAVEKFVDYYFSRKAAGLPVFEEFVEGTLMESEYTGDYRRKRPI